MAKKRKAKFRAGMRCKVTMEVTLARRHRGFEAFWLVAPASLFVSEKDLRPLTQREKGGKR